MDRSNKHGMQAGQWAWHIHALQVCVIDKIDNDLAVVTYHDFQHGAVTHKSPLIGQTCETFPDCLVPLELAPCYVSELLADWVDAIAENNARNETPFELAATAISSEDIADMIVSQYVRGGYDVRKIVYRDINDNVRFEVRYRFIIILD